jgi:hypothetical protein
MRKLFVQEGDKRLSLDFDDNVVIKVDDVVIDPPTIFVRSMTGGTKFKTAGDPSIYVRLSGRSYGSDSDYMYLREGTWLVWKADEKLQGRVVR